MTKAENKPKKHIPQRTCVACREVNEKKTLIRVVKSPSGRYVINVAEMKDGVVSWHMNETHYDFWRKGKLLYVR